MSVTTLASHQRVRTALASALVALAARLDTTPVQRQDAALSPANPA